MYPNNVFINITNIYIYICRLHDFTMINPELKNNYKK